MVRDSEMDAAQACPSRLTAEFSGGTPAFQHAGAPALVCASRSAARGRALYVSHDRCNDLLGVRSVTQKLLHPCLVIVEKVTCYGEVVGFIQRTLPSRRSRLAG